MVAVLVILIAVVVLGGAAVVVATRRRRGPELEPPPRRPAAPARPTPTAVEAPPEPELTPEQVAEIERALAEAEPEIEVIDLEEVEEVEEAPEPPEVVAPVKPRFRDRLGKARSLLSGYVGSILSRSAITNETWDEIEEALIRADVGMALTSSLLDDLRGRVKSEGITEPAALLEGLKDDLKK